MSLKDDLPTFEKGSPDLGGQLRALRGVIAKLVDAVESNPEAFASGGAAEPTETVEPPAATKPASKPATRAAAK